MILPFPTSTDTSPRLPGVVEVRKNNPHHNHSKHTKHTKHTKHKGAFASILADSRSGRAYLKELQAIHPLSRSDEQQLALRIEKGERMMLAALLQSPPIRSEILARVKSALAGDLPIEEILDLDPGDELVLARFHKIANALERTSQASEWINLLEQLPFRRDVLDRLENHLDPQDECKTAVAKSKRFAEAAMQELVRHHLWLAVAIASRHPSRGLDLLDRIQEGNLGLLQAAEKFRVRKGFRFATYAAFWIRRQINRAAAEQGHCVRIPIQTLEAACRAERIKHRFDVQIGHATEQQVAEAMSTSVERLREVRQGVSDPAPLEELLLDPKSPNAEQLMSELEQTRILRKQLDELEVRERRVLVMRFGIDGEEEASRDDVAEVFCLTRERIRQIEKQALERLRHPSRAGFLQAV